MPAIEVKKFEFSVIYLYSIILTGTRFTLSDVQAGMTLDKEAVQAVMSVK